MNPQIKPGLAIKARKTVTNTNCGINPDSAQGFVCKADANGISIYMEKGGGGYIEAVMKADVFAANFEEHRSRMDNPGYGKGMHFTKRYPENFLISPLNR